MRLKEEKMREVMTLKKVTPTEVMHRLGISRSHFCNLLKGRRKISVKNMKVLIELFGQDLMSRAIDWGGTGIGESLAVAR